MISELLTYDFMQRAILAVIAISIFSPILGLFLILRRQSLMSDTLSHVSLAGVAVGIFLGQSITWMTLVVVVIAALVLEYLRVSYKHYMEISTAILMSMGLAVALILSNKAGSSSMSLDSYLFGSIITISPEQVRALFVIAAIVLVLTLLFIRPMYLLTFDEDTAHVDGLPVRLMSLLFNIVTGIAIALMIPAAGSLLVSTIMILPAAIGMKIGQTFKSVIFWAIGIGLIGMLSGIFILEIYHYWFNSNLKNYFSISQKELDFSSSFSIIYSAFKRGSKSISGILVILGMILVGFVMGEKGWFDDESRGLIAKLVTQIALPCYMLYTITQRFTATDLLKMLPELRFPALSMAILLGIATAVAGIFAVKKERRGLFISMFFNSNTIFVGLPINQALFGDASIPYVLIYYMCNTTFFSYKASQQNQHLVLFKN